jgi:uncharacterized protein
MKAALLLLILQGLFGALDTVYFHEYRLRLPACSTAGRELKLHAARDFLYALLFGSLAWFTWNGFWAWLLIAVLSAEIILTLCDFVEEERSRKVPSGERTMHAIMGIVYGAFAAVFLPELLRWSRSATQFVYVDYGLMSWVLNTMAVGVFISGVRDISAAARTKESEKSPQLATPRI